LIGLELNNYSHLVWFNYTWCLDGIITIICVYLQMSIAKPLYKRLCIKCCKCHQCCFKIMQNVAKRRTYIIHRGQSKNLMVNNHSNTLSSRANQQNQQHSSDSTAQSQQPPVNHNINMGNLVNTITSPKYQPNNAQIHR